ncbi:MAG TPA: ATP-dependent helicase HrpB [Nitrospirales bacterium]|nr:ATP-dependent helicase HrpB [Nitrospirales bacterium]
MAPLPIEPVLPLLRRALAGRPEVILTAPPGAGKTTMVPPALLEEPWLRGRAILMLEPRRLAARAAASWMAASRSECVGGTIGYRMRLDTKVGPRTRIEVVTEGILTRLLQHDPALERYGIVIFDEFHERSLQSDLGLALTLDARRILRDDLRILVMSATLDCARLVDLFGHAPIVSCEGRQYPVETRYLNRPMDGLLDQAVAQTVRRAMREETGSVLVFLPGMAEIRHVERRLLEANLGSETMIAPLHGELPQEQQEMAIAPPSAGRRKIVLSTAIAETSLTIEGIRIVVDAGLMRVPRFDPGSGLTRLETLRVTQDAAEQRCGRAGRIEAGVCYRLWTTAEHQALAARRVPEILEADLVPLRLETAVWGAVDAGRLRWLDPPPSGALAQAEALLRSLGAVDGGGGITPHGRAIAALPIHPRLAHMIVRGMALGLCELACDLAALLSERDLLRGPVGWRDADLRLRVDALRHRVEPAAGVTFDRGVLARVRALAMQLRRACDDDRPSEAQSVASDDAVGMLLAFAYPDRIARRQPGDARRYLLANGRGAAFGSPEPLADAPYLIIADLEGGGDWSRIRLAAPIELADLERHSAEQFSETEFIAWDDQAQAVRARSQRRLGAIVLADVALHNPDPQAVVAALLDGIRRSGLEALAWTPELRQWQARVLLLRRAMPETSWVDVSDRALLDRLEDWLAPSASGIMRLEQLKRLDLAAALEGLLTWEQRRDLDRLAPTHVSVPTGSRIRLDYTAGDRPVLAVRLQEMFGCRETPTVANGRVGVLIHLLSPAGRPVQVTQDLAGFWRTSYHDVRKELRGRYPKHQWPDDPLTAAPTRRPKRRS